MECQERYINIITSYIVAEYVNEQDVVESDLPVPPSLNDPVSSLSESLGDSVSSPPEGFPH